LIEFTFPYAELELDGLIYGRSLSEVDVSYLLEKGFNGWQRYLIN
jgi:hypothetical protein